MAMDAAVLPKTQSAILADEAGNLVISRHVPLPELLPDMLLVKTFAVAVNPTDVKLTGPMAAPGATSGTDCAGTVVAIGARVAPGRFALGDRVCSPLSSMNPLAPSDGAFAEYARATAAMTLKVPDAMPLEAAATLGVGIATIGYALFRSLRIPGHPEKPAAVPAVVLVYGGSTSSGTMAIQLIRKSGCIPIAACSPKNFSLVSQYGAEKVFDYHDPESAEAIRAYTDNALDYALDCVCEGSSMVFCYKALGRAGGRYTTLEPFPEHLHTRKRVKPDWILGPALLGQPIAWKAPYSIKGDPELRVFGEEWFRCAQRLLDRGEITPHPARVGDKAGLEAVLEGVEILRAKAVSGEKLVYRLAAS